MRDLKGLREPLDLQFYAQAKSGKKKKTRFYLLILLIVVVLVAAFFIITNYENRDVKTLVGYFNEIDEIYDQALDYDKAGAGKSTPENWTELKTKAEDIKSKLDATETEDFSKNVKDAVSYYDDALITALTYGEDYARTFNPVTQNNVTRNLQEANLNRTIALDFLNDDFPREAKKINKNEHNPEVNQETIQKG